MSTTNDGFHPYQRHQSVAMSPYMVYPSNGLTTHSSSGATLSTSSSSNNNMNIQYFYVNPNMNMDPNWRQQAAMIPRYLPLSSSVKTEPMDVDPEAPALRSRHPAMHQANHQSQLDNHPSATIYTGRFDMQGHVSTQVPVSQQRGFPYLGMSPPTPMSSNQMSPYAWQEQQRYVQQTATQYARPTAMLDRNNMHIDPGSATMALQDAVQQRGPAAIIDDAADEGPASPDQVALPASVSIAHSRPTTPFRPTTTSFGSTTFLYDTASACPTTPMGMIGGGGAHFTTAGTDTSSSPLSSCSSWRTTDSCSGWRTDSGESMMMVDVKPPGGLSLRDVQGSSETNSPLYYSLQNFADSDSDSDSDNDNESSDGDEDIEEHEDEDAEGDEDEGSDNEDDDMPTTTIHLGPVKSYLEASPAESNVRSELVKNTNNAESDSPMIPLSPRFIPSDFQRASARVARQRIADTSDPIKARSITKSSSGTTAYKPKSTKTKKSATKTKRSAKPRIKASVKTIKAKRRKPVAVTSGATCRVPNPIPNFDINKKSRGRAVTTDPNAINSNVVHVCPVPSCGACFKRREHVKRHIRGLHTEDKPYECKFPGCTSSFTRGDNLKGHYIKVHKTTIHAVYETLGLPLVT